MSCCIEVIACTDNTKEEFKKHLKVVKFCVENDISLPKETNEYFKGAIDGDDLDEYDRDSWLGYIENGFETSLGYGQEYIEIDPKDIPKDTKKIIVRLSC